MNIGEIYTQHHKEKDRLGFSVLEKERADWFTRRLPSGGTFLDLGCRDGTLTRHFLEGRQVTAVDVDREALRVAAERCPGAALHEMDLLGDWSVLGGRKFDVILCSEVLEHVYFPDKVAQKIRAHLAPNGTFVGSVPNAFFLKHRMRYLLGRRSATPLDDPTHITQFNEQELRRVLGYVGSSMTLEGYTRPPFSVLAKKAPGLFAFDFLFAVRNP